MMVDITYDTIEGADGIETSVGWEVRRTLILEGITGTDPDMLKTAVETPGVPALGDTLTGFENLYLRERRPSALGDGNVRIDLIYRHRDATSDPGDPSAGATTTEVGTSLQQQDRTTDFNGDVMKTSYTPTGGDPWEDRPVIAPVLKPHSTIVHTRTEGGSPGAASRDYVGKVNSGSWSLDPGALARTWLCTSITGHTEDNGVTYVTTYVFEYNEDTWDHVAVYIDPSTGGPPKDVAVGNGIGTFQIYDEIGFNGMGLEE